MECFALQSKIPSLVSIWNAAKKTTTRQSLVQTDSPAYNVMPVMASCYHSDTVNYTSIALLSQQEQKGKKDW